MKWWQELNDWLSWRGVTWNDIYYTVVAISTLTIIIGYSIWMLAK